MNDKINQIAVSLISGIGHIGAKKLIAYCSDAEAVMKESKSALIRIPGIGSTIAQKVITGRNEAKDRAEDLYQKCSEQNINIHYFLEESYPQRLFHCEDGPLILYSKGDINLNPSRAISIVGTRNATVKGKAFCEKLIEELVPYDTTIISGLAYGIDITAHKAALNQKIPTQAVLACGLDNVYPKVHLKYAQQMQENGGLLSDYPINTQLLPSNFAERNRIIAGMSDAVIVIESSAKGGSLITANLANSYNRDVFAVPGRPDDSHSLGCNQLIKTNKAALIESAKDIAYILGWDEQVSIRSPQPKLFLDLSDNEKEIIHLFDQNQLLGVDEISIKGGLSMSQTSSLLLNLEFKGIIRSHPGKRFELIR